MNETNGELVTPNGPDASDFERWYRTHHARLRSFCTRLTGDAQTAEDIAQETLLRAWTRRASFDRDADIRAWLFTVARNLSIETLRSRAKLVATNDVPEHADVDADPVIPIERAEERRLVRSALGEISARHREMLIARDVDGVAYEELARRLGVSEETARAVLFRARRRLRERFIAATRAAGAVVVAFKFKLISLRKTEAAHGALAQAGASLFAAAVFAIGAHASVTPGSPPRAYVEATKAVASLSIPTAADAPIEPESPIVPLTRADAPAPGSSGPGPAHKPVNVKTKIDHNTGARVESGVVDPITGGASDAWVDVQRQAGSGNSVVLGSVDQTCNSNPALCSTVESLPQGVNP